MSNTNHSQSKKKSNDELTALQKHLLDIFSFDLSKKEMKELCNILMNYFNEKVTGEASKIWKEKKFTNRDLNKLLKEL